MSDDLKNKYGFPIKLTGFGEQVVIEGLPPGADVLILSVNTGHGRRPCELVYRHQLYTETLERAEEKARAEHPYAIKCEFEVIPINSEDWIKL